MVIGPFEKTRPFFLGASNLCAFRRKTGKAGGAHASVGFSAKVCWRDEKLSFAPKGLSIHAPREGSDCHAIVHLAIARYFNPRSP